MSREAMARLSRAGQQVSVANVTLDPAHATAFNEKLKTTPAIAGTVRIADMRTGFQGTIDESISVMNGLFIVVAVLITIGLTYNGARIQLSERARELAPCEFSGFRVARSATSLWAKPCCLPPPHNPSGGPSASGFHPQWLIASPPISILFRSSFHPPHLRRPV